MAEVLLFWEKFLTATSASLEQALEVFELILNYDPGNSPLDDELPDSTVALEARLDDLDDEAGNEDLDLVE